MAIARFRPLGVVADIDPANVPENYWTEAINMVPRPRGMERARGYQEIYATPLFGPTFLMATPQLGVKYWIYAGFSAVATVDPNGQHVDVTPDDLAAPVERNGWSGGNLNGIAVINSLENGPFYWFEGIGDQALPLPGQRPNTRYDAIRTFKYHVIGLGVTDNTGTYPDAIHWSDGADPGQIPATWVPAAENEAGDDILADESGAIIDGLALRDAFYIYKQDSVYEMTYTGGATVYQTRKVFGSTGVLTRNCVVRVKGTHVVLGNGDIYRHDGQSTESLVDGKMRDTFFAAIDDANYENSFAVYLEPREEVWFCVPSTGQERPDIALVWNVTTNEFGYRALPQCDFAAAGVVGEQQSLEVWDDDEMPWNSDLTAWLDQTINNTEDSVLLADADGEKFYLANTGVLAAGEPYRASIGKLSINLGDPEREKSVRRVWPHIEGVRDATYTLELFNQRDPMAAQEQVIVRDFQPGVHGVAVNINCRYLGMRIYSDTESEWFCSGFDVDYSEQGRF